jgi:hypothetical protein
MPIAPGYPKKLVHPAHHKAVPRSLGRFDPVTGKELVADRQDWQGEPDRFPPVTVYDADNEELYRAKGYRLEGEAATMTITTDIYPLMLVHPDHIEPTPAEQHAKREEDGKLVMWTTPGHEGRFPHVIANNEIEEKRWLAKGYKRPGTPDPEAVERAYSSPGALDYEPSEYPRWEATGEVDAEGKPILKLVQDPNIDRLPPQYPKWLTTGKNAAGEPQGVIVGSLAEEVAARATLGLDPLPVAPSKLPPGVTINRERQAELQALSAAAVVTPPLTRGQKIAATKARKKAERAAVQGSLAS